MDTTTKNKSLEGKLWEVELVRKYSNNKGIVHVYGIIYSKTIISPITGLYDDDWIETQVKASDVFRNEYHQLCFYSIKPVEAITVENGKIKAVTI